MAYTGYIKTEVNLGAKTNGWLWIKTYINQQPTKRLVRHLPSGSIYYNRQWANSLTLYCHQNAAPEPITDGHIKTTSFDDSDTTFSGGEGYIKSFTSSTGIFTVNQSLSAQPEWIINYNARNTDLSPGYVGNIRFEFYKRGNQDTYLFGVESAGVGGLFSATGLTLGVMPLGQVTTNDRLRIRVYMFESWAT